ncbi:MAG: redoxin domain-containing protein [Clostridiales bacterium]|nr:redoxin domain-containing protein [Clostridiales bacterium]
MRQRYDKIQYASGEVIVISFEEEDGVRRLATNHKLPFTFLLDPQKQVYRRYGMVYREKGPVITWRTVIAYLRLRFAGYPRQPKGKDVRQMGGDVIIDTDGNVQFIHRSKFPEDRPPVDEMMKILGETR